ncbi:abc-type multidrug transport atpase component [Leptolyngbya sp. Heron Island J]|uniref:ABC transporter ATP-binding protein n=1 Tax=Leptolyngbya sp. Heron Island J TaxID=1385935 RepID=UPI0003B9622D|nr:ABC transporter ATP-binding protein [Leptolyngbya sp. Heron Island J]ESA37879.1 abc-type multidrug transport atpase component [Leptolyngbya sp. Heron Island J]
MTLPLPMRATGNLLKLAGNITLDAQHLKKSYGRGKQRFDAVRDVSLRISAGEVLAFLGPNGAGKTTTIKMIGGLVRPDAGQVRIDGLDPHQQSMALKRVGAVLEGNRNLYWRLTPLENIEYFGGLRQVPRQVARQRGEQLLEQFGLSDKRKTPVQKLSRGMQQKLAIAVALVHQPTLLLLDEPTLGLDVEASETVKTLVRDIAAAGCGILLTTHQLDVAEELSDRVAIIRQGQIIAEQPTHELIRQFSGSAYHIDCGQPIDIERAKKIMVLGGTVSDNQVHFPGDALYELLDIVRPLPIREIRQDRADLTDVFLSLMRDVESEQS